MRAGFSPDDAEHSPVSDKWELYLISVNEAVAPYRLGDVNDDGYVDITDATTLINYLLSSDPTGVNLIAADMNEDGKVDIFDSVYLRKILIAKI